MINREFVEKIEEMAGPKITEINGQQYSDRVLNHIKYPAPPPLRTYTLRAVADYIMANVDSLDFERCFLHIMHPGLVELGGALGSGNQRFGYISAQTVPGGFRFGEFQDIEMFIVGLMTQFEQSADRDSIIELVGNIRDEDIRTIQDDGVSQEVTVKKGVAAVGPAVVPKIVELAPYRTFREIEQPTSKFLLRLKKGPGDMPYCALFEADGEGWQLEAINRIHDWFVESKLPAGLAVLA